MRLYSEVGFENCIQKRVYSIMIINSSPKI